MGTRTIDQLETEARQRADMESDDSFITSAEAFRMINQSIKELYDLLIENQGHEYYITTQSISTVAGTSSYALNSAFYQLLGVDATVGSTVFTVRPFMFQERNAYSLGAGWGGLEPVYYRVEGSNIVFIPAPMAVHSVTVWYIPQFTDLTTGQTFDGINGWEEYVVVDVAMKMLEKEESDTSHLMTRKALLTERIKALASRRDAGSPSRVVDVIGTNLVYGDE